MAVKSSQLNVTDLDFDNISDNLKLSQRSKLYSKTITSKGQLYQFWLTY